MQWWYIGEAEPRVNFTNIISAAFAPIFLRQKSTNIKSKYKKVSCETCVLVAYKWSDLGVVTFSLYLLRSQWDTREMFLAAITTTTTTTIAEEMVLWSLSKIMRNEWNVHYIHLNEEKNTFLVHFSTFLSLSPSPSFSPSLSFTLSFFLPLSPSFSLFLSLPLSSSPSLSLKHTPFLPLSPLFCVSDYAFTTNV